MLTFAFLADDFPGGRHDALQENDDDTEVVSGGRHVWRPYNVRH
ncbi:MAG TPA: hypothetical protein VHL11_18885 [Phototrophicaceae bacterium]|nr:hypothetical protein [Phototrophicaceae bacterium]